MLLLLTNYNCKNGQLHFLTYPEIAIEAECFLDFTYHFENPKIPVGLSFPYPHKEHMKLFL